LEKVPPHLDYGTIDRLPARGRKPMAVPVLHLRSFGQVVRIGADKVDDEGEGDSGSEGVEVEVESDDESDEAE
jgi:hypothetical protein